MKQQDISALHHKNTEELTNQIKDLEKKLVEARMNKALGITKNVHEVASLRKDIARIKTILHLKQKTAATTPTSKAAKTKE